MCGAPLRRAPWRGGAGDDARRRCQGPPAPPLPRVQAELLSLLPRGLCRAATLGALPTCHMSCRRASGELVRALPFQTALPC
jgi:hypothetical protein